MWIAVTAISVVIHLLAGNVAAACMAFCWMLAEMQRIEERRGEAP